MCLDQEVDLSLFVWSSEQIMVPRKLFEQSQYPTPNPHPVLTWHTRKLCGLSFTKFSQLDQKFDRSAFNDQVIEQQCWAAAKAISTSNIRIRSSPFPPWHHKKLKCQVSLILCYQIRSLIVHAWMIKWLSKGFGGLPKRWWYPDLRHPQPYMESQIS